ncbi:DUF6438 domain-containing protein [Phenylobacterium sp.]|uniref:DUF6438 domain-containing protein n=1 Tax=Phenylobacterium sp. TaxID=1871053 RepID=UPI00374DA8A1
MRLTALTIALSAATTVQAETPCPPLEVFRPSGGPAAYTVVGRSPRVPPPMRHLPVPAGALASVEIALARSGCFGNCPSYTVAVRGDGTGVYEGGRFVLVYGKHKFQVEPAQVACLLQLFRDADFWSLSDSYSAQITDNPHYQVRLSIGGRTKMVSDYAGEMVGMPASVTALEDAVDALGARRWVLGDASTQAALRGEGFDFKSFAGAKLLAMAVISAPDEMVFGLLAEGTPIDGHAEGFSAGPDGLTPLQGAAREGRARVAATLIKAGALASASPDAKAALLRIAVESGDPATVREILAAGAQINQQSNQDHPPITLVWSSRYTDSRFSNRDVAGVIRVLLSAGADPRAHDENLRTALHFADGADGITLLLKAGGELEAHDGLGRTPLLSAQSDEAAVALIQAGANVRAKADNGETFEVIAKRQKFTNALALLRAQSGSR